MKPVYLFLFMLLCVSLSSCQMIEDSVYPIIDYVTVTKNTNDIYARHDYYSEDTLCPDRQLVKVVERDATVSTHYQYLIESPKVAWQKNHLDWLNSRSGAKVRKYLLMLLVVLSVTGLLVPFFGTLWWQKYIQMQLSRKQKAADKAFEKKAYDKAEKLYYDCEALDKRLHNGRGIDMLQYRIMPYALLAMVLVEGLYLFMFNFKMPLISMSCVGPFTALFNIFMLTIAVASQMLMMYLYSDALDSANGAKSSPWWKFHIGWFIALAFCVMVLKNIFVLPLDIIAVVWGIVCCGYVLAKDKNVKNLGVKIYAISLLLMSYIFLYFLSYVLLIITTIVLIAIGVMLALKIGNVALNDSIDQMEIRKIIDQHPGMTYNQAQHQYYEGKRQKAREEAKRNQMF